MKNVEDLTQTELEELRSRWYHEHLDDGSLYEVMGREIEDETDIPMEIVKAYYSDTFFVDEDFFCNLNKCECGGLAKTFNTLTGGGYCDDCIKFLEQEGYH